LRIYQLPYVYRPSSPTCDSASEFHGRATSVLFLLGVFYRFNSDNDFDPERMGQGSAGAPSVRSFGRSDSSFERPLRQNGVYPIRGAWRNFANGGGNSIDRKNSFTNADIDRSVCFNAVRFLFCVVSDRRERVQRSNDADNRRMRNSSD